MQNKSFTIIELIIAIFVILTALVAGISLIAGTISNVSVYKSKLIAAYLSQEGIEIVRNIRDTNWIQDNNWKDSLFLNNDFYNFDYRSKSIPDDLNCSGKNYLKVNGNVYNCSDSLANFQRKVHITEPETDVLEVIVTIEWQERGKTYSFTAQEKLYKWR